MALKLLGISAKQNVAADLRVRLHPLWGYPARIVFNGEQHQLILHFEGGESQKAPSLITDTIIMPLSLTFWSPSEPKVKFGGRGVASF